MCDLVILVWFELFAWTGLWGVVMDLTSVAQCSEDLCVDPDYRGDCVTILNEPRIHVYRIVSTNEKVRGGAIYLRMS